MSGNSKKTAVSQSDLRKLMSGSVNKTGGGSSKRYKVSAREQALMEEQKRAKLAEKEKKAAKASAAAAALAASLPASDAKPVKSILKKSTVVPPPSYQPPVKSFVEPPPPPPPSSALAMAAPSATPDTSLTVAPSSLTPSKPGQEDAESKGALPEGFFDDPIMDAKARGVAYVDKEEEEWEAFQKEIEAEETVAQNILVEDRTEATADRQIEEIDEQIEAWQR